MIQLTCLRLQFALYQFQLLQSFTVNLPHLLVAIGNRRLQTLHQSYTSAVAVSAIYRHSCVSIMFCLHLGLYFTHLQRMFHVHATYENY